jgi:hypothetical protein
MTMITCSECGRAVSDKAATCVGCGAPLARPNSVGSFNLVPEERPLPPPTARQLRRRALLASVALVVGVIWSGSADHHGGHGRIPAVLAAFLVVGGLCGLLVTLVQNFALRNAPPRK